MTPAGNDTVRVHPLLVRIAHWINAFAILILVASGWRIYNASPLFDFKFPADWTLGGWLAGALQWHFAAMWLLALNGLVYVAYGIASGHFRRKLLPITPSGVWHDVTAAVRGKLAHDDLRAYNTVQRAAYLGHRRVVLRTTRRSGAARRVGEQLGGTVVERARGRADLVLEPRRHMRHSA